MVSTDEGLQVYLNSVLSQISDWLEQGQLEKLVLVIANVHTKEVMERWTFDIETDKEALEKGEMRSKPEKEIQSEIQAIIRQITASVTFLPLLEDPCSFDLLVYTSKESVVPSAWEESDPRYIANSSQVRLRSFTTKVHKVDAMVAYRTEEE